MFDILQVCSNYAAILVATDYLVSWKNRDEKTSAAAIGAYFSAGNWTQRLEREVFSGMNCLQLDKKWSAE